MTTADAAAELDRERKILRAYGWDLYEAWEDGSVTAIIYTDDGDQYESRLPAVVLDALELKSGIVS